MLVDIVMPRLSDSMEEGVILKWLKKVGDSVARGEDLVEIETDKANMTYASDTAGKLVEVVAEEGSVLPVGEVIARIEAEGRIGSEQGPSAAVEKTQRASDTSDVVEKPSKPATPPEIREEDRPRVKASPIARRLAAEVGVDLGTVSGSGPDGRIVKADVEGATHARQPAAVVGASTNKGRVTVIEPTRLQETVARRMSESKATIPDFSETISLDATEMVSLRGELKRLASSQAPSLNDMIVKAVAVALSEHPRLNGSWRDGHFELYERINIGVAVASEDGLTVPTLFDADRKSLGEIAKETKELAAAVRSGTVTPPQLAGGTFTVSNLGMFGIDRFNAVINPPQAAILAVGTTRREPTVDSEGGICVRERIELTLSCDHRIVYGDHAAKFLERVRTILEEPAALTL